MTDDALVSVVIPTYNRAYCVPRAIDSVLGQSHGQVQALVIDDGSTDGTAELIAKRYAGDTRVRYHRQDNKGISGARNTGLARAEGAYVAFLDSDDDWVPWKLELQIACMRAHPELGMTWTDMKAVDSQGNVTSEAYLRRMYDAYRWFPTASALFKSSQRLDAITQRAAEVCPDRWFYFGDIGAQMLMGNLVHTSTVVLTRARAEKIGSFREDLRFAGEDYEYHLRTCQAGPVGYLDVASIRYHRGRTDQATDRKNDIHLANNFLRVIEPILKSTDGGVGLPRHMQRAALAEAHAWVGHCHLNRNEAAAAFRHLAHSLAIDPWHAHTARLLVASCLPPTVRSFAQRLYHTVRPPRPEPKG
jgi:glycosyltransferase involved in cell wall biosynthesis